MNVKREIAWAVTAGCALSLVVSYGLYRRSQAQWAHGEEQIADYRRFQQELGGAERLELSAESAFTGIAKLDTMQAAELAALRREHERLSREIARMEHERSQREAAKGAIGDYAEGAAGLFLSVPADTLKEQNQRVEGLAPRKLTARLIGSAVRRYARNHEGEIPSRLEEAVPYASDPIPEGALNDFEMVFQGNTADLEKIPHGAVALLREREPWPISDGRLGRIYIMMAGNVWVVESESQFVEWEANHIVPAGDVAP